MRTDLHVLARVLLHKDGSVHLCIEDKSTFYATASNLRAFFSDPIRYIQKGIRQECESTQEINSDGRLLRDIPGVTLAYLSRNKEIICNFPELFQFVFSSTGKSANNQRLSMEQYCSGTKLTDAKSFLLWFYLIFVKNLGQDIKIQQKLEISREVFFDALGEIFDSVFTIEEPSAPSESVSDRIHSAAQAHLFNTLPESENSDYIPYADFAAKHGRTYDEILILGKGELRAYVKNINGQHMINKHAPVPPKKRRKKSQSKTSQPASVPVAEMQETSEITLPTAADIEAYVRANKLFSPTIGQAIAHEKELRLYEDYGFIEVNWYGRPCLVKDFDIHYVCADGRTNRERMLNGEAPMSKDPGDPTAPEKAVEVHHIGQTDAAFATVDYYLHHKAGLYGLMHPRKGKSNDELHGETFEWEKTQLWQYYIANYEKAGSFDKIKHNFPAKKSK